MRFALLALVAGLLASAFTAGAHEVRPAYLQIDETAPGRYEILWRTPVLSGMRLPVVLELPEGVEEVRAPVVQTLPGARLEYRVVEPRDGDLFGKRIRFVGLEGTITDVLVRTTFREGSTSTTLVHPSQPWVEISPAAGRMAVAAVYLDHGVRHILFGWDHLLFVLALILLVRSLRVLLVTITSFTVAHSITLALAVLGVVSVPGPPIEAMIALSIVLLAHEFVRRERGDLGLAGRWPWVIAFCFGLLHGFGFASALTETGLPQSAVPLALLAFNVGVELGQIAFVAAILGLQALVGRSPLADPFGRRARSIAVYAIGSLGAFWFVERVAGF